jgi:hypothetical protein
VLNKIEKPSLDLSCTITETFNEVKLVCPSYFLESFDSCVGRIVESSFAFSQHSGCVKMYFILYIIIMYDICILIFCIQRMFV